MGLKQIVAANIRECRLEKRLSQEEAAHRIGISVSYLGQIERGRRNISVEVLGSIAEAIGVPISRLIEQPPGEADS